MNLKDYQNGRNDGLLMAQRIVKNDGIEALDAEIKFRRCTRIHTSVTKKELEIATVAMRDNIMDTIMIMAVATLRDEFDFGAKRLERFMKRFHAKADCLSDGNVSWMDIIETLEDETGIKTRIRWNNEDYIIRQED